MKTAAIAGALSCAIAASLPVAASARDLPDHWEPAMLFVSADTGLGQRIEVWRQRLSAGIAERQRKRRHLIGFDQENVGSLARWHDRIQSAPPAPVPLTQRAGRAAARSA